MLSRKHFISSVAASALLAGITRPAKAEEDWGRSEGYPSGWGPAGQMKKWEAYPAYRVGNFSGGFESMFKFNRIKAGNAANPLKDSPKAISYRSGFSHHSAEDYIRNGPVTGLLIARRGEVMCEHYGFQRTAAMRMTSWSMAKSVTSLLLGIALDKGLVRSIDDLPQDYVPALRGTLHGQVKIRHLLNMSSGADVVHERDPVRIDVPGLLGPGNARTVGTDVERVVREWNTVREPQGTLYNYNELCPLTIGMVIRSASRMSLAQFAQEHLWQPMGAEGDATWLTDSLGKEYNCVGFAAQLRDWGRMAQLIAQNGMINGRQVVSAPWIEACASHSPQDAQVRYGSMRPDMGYKNFFWHPKPNGAWLMMNGAIGQRVMVDRASQTVLVQMRVGDAGPWQKDLFALFEAAIDS